MVSAHIAAAASVTMGHYEPFFTWVRDKTAPLQSVVKAKVEFVEKMLSAI